MLSIRLGFAAGGPGLALLLAALLAPASAPALETVDDQLWIANNDVTAMAQDGNTLYLAGNFDVLGPPTGAFASLDLVTGAPTVPVDRVALSSTADGVYVSVPAR